MTFLNPAANFIPFLPELVLAGTALTLLLLGLYRGIYAFHRVMVLSKIALAAVLLMVCVLPPSREVAFQGLFLSDAFTILMKALVVGSALATLTISRTALAADNIIQFEYPVLVLFATLGMMLMISANDLMSLFMGLELQSLCLYILVALPRDMVKSSEAAIKYFVLGSLSTCLLLYGSSLLYGYAGTTSFEGISAFLKTSAAVPLPLKAALAFIVAGLAFKISVAPFHMWTPDVYDGAPLPITTFIASAPKIAAFALFVRVFTVSLPELWPYWQPLLIIIAMLSMVLGAFAALRQTSIRRLIAYSAIGNMGYVLTGVALATEEGIIASIVYIILYLIMVTGIFACLLNITHRNQATGSIDDLKGLVHLYPGTAFILSFLFFSLAGIPPLAGFLGKLYIFQAAISAQFYGLAFVGVLSSVVAAAYYLWLVKIILMDAPLAGSSVDNFRNYRHRPALTFALAGTVGGLIWLFLAPSPLVRIASEAAACLFDGQNVTRVVNE